MITLCLAFGLGLLALAPFVWLLLMSFGTGWSSGLAPTAMDPDIYPRSLLDILPGIRLTLVYATAAGLLVLLLGSGIGVLTRRTRRTSRMALFLTTLLFAVPGLALALAYAHGYGLLGLNQDNWPRFAWPALALVVALKQAPLAQHLIAARLRRLHDGELTSAYSLGASRYFVALRIGLPSLSGVLGIVFLLGCSAALIELSVAMLLIQGPPLPVSLHLFRSLLTPEDIQTPASQALLFVLLTTSVFLILWWLAHRVCKRTTPLPRHISSPARTHP
jgi:ABC-type Fe3+ transport system permease subunit